eukprot:5492592-Prorocentrum_lima.AAC.1
MTQEDPAIVAFATRPSRQKTAAAARREAIALKNYITGRWVLIVKRDKQGAFQKHKARWVWRGFQHRQ